MDGKKVLAWLQGQDALKDLPVIALTAHAMAGDREKYLSIGFNEYVTKPIMDEDLLIDAAHGRIQRQCRRRICNRLSAESRWSATSRQAHGQARRHD